MTSVAGKGPRKIIFIFCCTHAIYSSSGFKILTEHPRKWREELLSLLSELLFIYFGLFFIQTSLYKAFSGLGKTLSGPLFQDDKFEWELDKEEERLKHYCSWPLGCRIHSQNYFREMDMVSTFYKLNQNIKYFYIKPLPLKPM